MTQAAFLNSNNHSKQMLKLFLNYLKKQEYPQLFCPIYFRKCS